MYANVGEEVKKRFLFALVESSPEILLYKSAVPNLAL